MVQLMFKNNQENMKRFIITEEQANTVLNKLSLFPYKDVFQEIAIIQAIAQNEYKEEAIIKKEKES